MNQEIEQNNIVNVCSTFHDLDEAKSIIISAIKQKLAISADYWMVNSFYPWDNVIEEVDQYNVSFTTYKNQVDKLIDFIEANHSYKIPFVTGYKTDFLNNKYKTWSEKTLHDNTKYITRDEADEIEKEKEIEAYKLK